MSAAALNGSDAGKVAAPQKPPLKSASNASNAKGADVGRKHTSSPVDGQNRKQQASQPKAWQGVNPITQRASASTSPAPTSNSTDKSPSKSASHSAGTKRSADGQTGRQLAHDRALFLLASFTGHDATITLRNGEKFSGIFSVANLEVPSKVQYTLKMVKRLSPAGHHQTNGATAASSEYIGEGEDHVMIFDRDDTVELAVADVKTAGTHATQNGSIESSFRTDTQILARDQSIPRERELQRWVAGPSDPSLDLSLEDSGKGGWDQFAANERLYGVQSTYDENMYTTSIDRSNPAYRKREADAARIAREIEGSTAANAHVAEERRRDAEAGDGLDEEEKYSGVRRESTALPKRAAGAYVPPSHRPITNAPTIPGAPFDPAIVSLARPSPSPSDKSATQTTANGPPTSSEQPAAPSGLTAQEQQAAQAVPTAKKNTTEGYVRDLTDHFKQFANNEKLRVRQVQEAKRTSARAEKNVKLNDLKKFAENFKLKSRVPDDLVPILAKDREKQVQIQSKAELAAKEEEVRAKERDKEKVAVPSPIPSRPSEPAASGQSASTTRGPGVSGSQSQASQSGSQAPSLPAQPPTQRRNLPSSNGIRPIEPLPANLRDLHKAPVLPRPEPIPSPSLTPKLNVNAKAFEFRPGANAFAPTGTSPSPQRLPADQFAPAPAVNFFEGKKPAESREHPSMDASFSSMKGLQSGEYSEEQKKSFASNKGIPRPYQTPPTWPVSEDHINKSYKDNLSKGPTANQTPSPMQTPNPGQMTLAHQMPHHFQQSHMGGPAQRGQFMAPSHHGHGPASFDPSRGQHFGPNGSVHNSPRGPPMQMTFGGQMPGMAQFPGQQMQYPGMSPSMQYRQIHPNAQGMMMMGQPPGQMSQMPQGGFGRGPSGFPPQMMGGAPMMPQVSGGFPGGPMPQQVFSPMQQQAQPHMGPGGFGGSPRPGSHMMQHSGSHQGFAPQSPMPHHMQQGGPPLFGSPGQPHPYHFQQQQRQQGAQQGQRYPQMTPRQQAAVPQRVHPSPGAAAAAAATGGAGDEGK